MKYRVTAYFIKEHLPSLYDKLSSGLIDKVPVFGHEISNSMKRAVLHTNGKVEWFEECFCETPLKQEIELFYNHYFTDILTEVVTSFQTIEGTNFYEYMSTHQK